MSLTPLVFLSQNLTYHCNVIILLDMLKIIKIVNIWFFGKFIKVNKKKVTPIPTRRRGSLQQRFGAASRTRFAWGRIVKRLFDGLAQIWKGVDCSKHAFVIQNDLNPGPA